MESKTIIEPILKIDYNNLAKMGVSEADIKGFIPDYISTLKIFHYGHLKKLVIELAVSLLIIGLKLGLNPRKGPIGDLDPGEVKAVYTKEAETYDAKHHFTTRGQDTIWRRLAAYCVVNYAVEAKGPISVLDLCTGTGLTPIEIIKLSNQWKVKINLTCLDYTPAMLRAAEKNLRNYNKSAVLVRGDATDMCGTEEGGKFIKFKNETFNVITQVFGIGGISEPIKAFHEVLKLLKKGGQFFLIDMHRPVKELSGEWLLFGRWIKMPIFDAVCYEKFTIPLALNRLWGWRDTTSLFYLVRLVTIKDGRNSKYYGFRVLNFEINPERWYLGIPIMNTAKITLEKIEISRAEHKLRKKMLSACSS